MAKAKAANKLQPRTFSYSESLSAKQIADTPLNRALDKKLAKKPEVKGTAPGAKPTPAAPKHSKLPATKGKKAVQHSCKKHPGTKWTGNVGCPDCQDEKKPAAKPQFDGRGIQFDPAVHATGAGAEPHRDSGGNFVRKADHYEAPKAAGRGAYPDTFRHE